MEQKIMETDALKELQQFAQSGRGLMGSQEPELWDVWSTLESQGYITFTDGIGDYARFAITEKGRAALSVWSA